MSARVVFDPANALREAIALHRQGRLEDAEGLYRKIIAQRPDQPDALHFLGILEAQRGRRLPALQLMDRAIAANPRHPAMLYNRANLLREMGRLDDALAGYDAALAVKPDNFAAHGNRGAVLHALARYKDAVDSYDRALMLDPGNADIHANRGDALVALARYDEALASYDRALARDPGNAECLNNHGLVLSRLCRHEDALARFDSAIAAAPANVAPIKNRAMVLMQLGRYADALAAYAKALELSPDEAEALYGRASALAELDQDEAIAAFGQLLRLHPDYPYALGMLVYAQKTACDWRDESAVSAMLDAVRAGKRAATPLVLLAASDSAPLKLRCAQIAIEDKFRPAERPLWHGETYRHDRIRVAYLSADFRNHPVAVLMAGVFEHHDRARFQTIALSYGPDDASAMRARLVRGFERFIDVCSKSDLEAANLIREMEADILVDLTGLTASGRPGIPAFRPAPVQVNYLGFAGSIGASYADYILADRVVIPEDQRPFYTENVVYLPDCYMPHDSRRAIAERMPERAELGLPHTGFVFASFNNSYKFTVEIFDIWMRLLGKTEGSVLWLPAANAAARRNLTREAQNRGIAAERLVFAPRATALEDHLARLSAADLFLDTLPYNAHTTTSDALWAGLPVLTCKGESFAASVGASLLRACAMPEMIAHSLAAYEDKALALARDAAALDGVRAKLRRNRDSCALFDTARFTRNLEHAYTTMWERSERGEKPSSFAVEPVLRP